MKIFAGNQTENLLSRVELDSWKCKNCEAVSVYRVFKSLDSDSSRTSEAYGLRQVFPNSCSSTTRH